LDLPGRGCRKLSRKKVHKSQLQLWRSIRNKK
jgi:hypothetical protein